MRPKAQNSFALSNGMSETSFKLRPAHYYSARAYRSKKHRLIKLKNKTSYNIRRRDTKRRREKEKSICLIINTVWCLRAMVRTCEPKLCAYKPERVKV